MIGSRGRGKTYKQQKRVLRKFIKKGHQFIWTRMSSDQTKLLLENSAAQLFKPELLQKFKVEKIEVRGSNVLINGRLAGCVLSLAKQADIKGLALDSRVEVDELNPELAKTLKNKAFGNIKTIVFDEINREVTEKKMFNIPRAFVNFIESIARLKKDIICYMMGNTIGDTSDILDLFGFNPKEFGFYKIPKRHCLIEYLADSEEWLEERANSMAGVLLDKIDADSFTNKSGPGLKYRIVKRPAVRNHLYKVWLGTRACFDMYDTEFGIWIDNMSSYYSRNMVQFSITPNWSDSEKPYNAKVRDAFFKLYQTGELSYSTYTTAKSIENIIRLAIAGK